MAFVTINGCNIHYEIAGEHAENCLLFIGGLGMNLDFWLNHYAPSLHRPTYSILMFNSRGVAPSEKTPPPYTVADLAQDCKSLIEVLGFKNVCAVGASLGSFVAQELALICPERVRGLFLISTYGRQPTISRAIMQAEGDIYRANQYPPKSYMLVSDLLQVYSWRDLTNDRVVTTALRTMDRHTDYHDPGRQGLFFATCTYDGRLDHLADIRARTFVVGFEEDVLTPAGLCREVAAVVPGAQYFEIKGVGHSGIFSRKAEILPLLQRFLSEIEWSAGETAASEPGH